MAIGYHRRCRGTVLWSLKHIETMGPHAGIPWWFIMFVPRKITVFSFFFVTVFVVLFYVPVITKPVVGVFGRIASLNRSLAFFELQNGRCR